MRRRAEQWRRLWPGVAMAVLVAMAALSLAEHYRAPVMLFALLLGMAVNFLSEEGRCQAGIDFVARQVLRWGVAMLGLKITWDQVQALGWLPLALVVLAVLATIGFGLVLARLLGFQPFFGFLSGGAVGICGASAALAISAAFPQHPQKDRATLFVVVSVSTLSTLAMLLYPMALQAWGLSPRQAGFFLGGTIHDVAQVVGAAYSMGAETGDVATLVKLIRVAMLVPVIAAAAWMTRRLPAPHFAASAVLPASAADVTPAPDQGTPQAQAASGPAADAALDGASASTSASASDATAARPPLLPGFALVFVLLVLVNGLYGLPPLLVDAGGSLSRWCLVAAMAAIGMKTHLQDILRVGWKPVLLMLLETLFLAALVRVLLAVFPV